MLSCVFCFFLVAVGHLHTSVSYHPRQRNGGFFMDQNKETDRMPHEESAEVLRCRFTRWMEVLIYRVKLNYLSSLSKKVDTISLDELIDKGFQAEDPTNGFHSIDSISSFSFTEDRIVEAIKKLSPRRREILELLYIHMYKPEEVAQMLNCSLQNIYNRRSRAIKDLRAAILEEDGDNDGQ